jgi:hypothetical protein
MRKRSLSSSIHLWLALVGAVYLLVSAGPVTAEPEQGGVVFEEVGVALGVTYERVPSTTLAIAQAFRDDSLITPKTLMDVPLHPLKTRGAPGVAILDFDGDGDLDIYVTNGPGASNSLLSNQLDESGSLGFVDIADSAGVGAADQDSTGVCFGDIDNDGDEDLYVLGRNEDNRLFENDGAGSFLDITVAAGVGGDAGGSSSCSFGDVNNDGLLDLFVANVTDFVNMLAILVEPFALNEPNQLFLNDGANVFSDVSDTSGIRVLSGVPPETSDITWATTLVDYDQDGDIDILTAADNGGIPFAADGGVDRGFLRVFENDGSGSFTDVTGTLLAYPGDWMGISVADFNHDGRLDMFGSNTGDYFEALLGIPGSGLGAQTSRHFLQNSDGTWSDTGPIPDLASVFGWGTAAFDYDNDGDTDIAYVGGLDAAFFLESSNPGVILQNQGGAGFALDETALVPPISADHARRTEHGMAVGDLDGNGFVDMVSVANQDSLLPLPFVLYADVMPILFTSPFNALAGFVPIFAETMPGSGEWVWTGLESANGTVAIELNSGGNGHHSIAVQLVGSAGLITGGATNRDGIGAVVALTPLGGSTAIQPVLGGSSYASQNSLIQTFGLGRAKRGQLDILWPGGVRNRLYDVKYPMNVVFPEIPCSYDGGWPSFASYRRCVGQALDELVAAGVLQQSQKGKFFSSAVRAFMDEQ